jgi:hypothetical protein
MKYPYRNKGKQPLPNRRLPTTDNSLQQESNNIQRRGLWVNTILAVFTFLLFLISTQANKTASDAVEQAREANRIALQYLEFSKKSSEIDSINTANSLDISQKSLQTQIDAFTQAQNRFTIENRPFVQVTDVIIDTAETKVTARFRFSNLGKFPGKILKANYGAALGVARNLSDITDKPLYMEKLYNNSVGSGYGVGSEVSLNTISKDDMKINYASFKKGEAYFYLYGNVSYQNIMTLEVYKCNFIYQIAIVPTKDVVTLLNN